MQIRAVILAAGASRRAGAQKLLADFRGRRMIEYAIDAAAEWGPLVVAGSSVADALRTTTGITVIRNAVPERGMSYSLKLADARLPKEAWLMLLLGDKPLVTGAIIRKLCRSLEGADVVYPVHPKTGVPGHPVFFSPAARAQIAALDDGDTIQRIRDNADLVRRPVPEMEEGAYFDVDAL
ncbi:MAG TPA: NTP transferase domain-containing protein [Candidatus Baltobacteraceae bacterium]|jgi:molybdenum cofactor cytidylyltransferase|nr:NTP transferase domain-containing protein [Candidatus Baltobacteraceae bacterium]